MLERLKIPYAIIGAFAASFYGLVRASLDVDAVISIDREERIAELLALFKKEGLKAKFTRGDFNDPVDSVINIEDKFRNRVDLLTGIRGMDKRVFNRAVTSSFLNVPLRLISVEDFIAMKIFAGSPKDIEDVLGVLKVSENKIDISLLKKLTLHYGKKELARVEKILAGLE